VRGEVMDVDLVVEIDLVKKGVHKVMGLDLIEELATVVADFV
jgi:hypothetical protein